MGYLNAPYHKTQSPDSMLQAPPYNIANEMSCYYNIGHKDNLSTIKKRASLIPAACSVYSKIAEWS